MLRAIYLATLSILQLALIVEVAPPLALALRANAFAGHVPAGWPSLLQLVAIGTAAVGAAIALVFPGVALARHQRAGAMRFLGLPRWAVAMAIAGAFLLGAATLGLLLASALTDEARIAVLLVTRPGSRGGLALATAGALCSELLRRSVPPRKAGHAARRARGRIEVTYPPEHRTYALLPTVPHVQGGPG